MPTSRAIHASVLVALVLAASSFAQDDDLKIKKVGPIEKVGPIDKVETSPVPSPAPESKRSSPEDQGPRLVYYLANGASKEEWKYFPNKGAAEAFTQRILFQASGVAVPVKIDATEWKENPEAVKQKAMDTVKKAPAWIQYQWVQDPFSSKKPPDSERRPTPRPTPTFDPQPLSDETKRFLDGILEFKDSLGTTKQVAPGNSGEPKKQAVSPAAAPAAPSVRDLNGNWVESGGRQRLTIGSDGSVTYHGYAAVSGRLSIQGTKVKFSTNEGWTGFSGVDFEGELNGGTLEGTVKAHKDGHTVRIKVTRTPR